ncbi:hypothetical protein [Absidia glauca]|uniref:Uncharacterized protein n=1 Tax=Absidia glauca TaxID=4829 RepID=A0A163J5L8_ABSGL|nr:hypothetical protein [Absidia glauca]
MERTIGDFKQDIRSKNDSGANAQNVLFNKAAIAYATRYGLANDDDDDDDDDNDNDTDTDDDMTDDDDDKEDDEYFDEDFDDDMDDDDMENDDDDDDDDGDMDDDDMDDEDEDESDYDDDDSDMDDDEDDFYMLGKAKPDMRWTSICFWKGVWKRLHNRKIKNDLPDTIAILTVQIIRRRCRIVLVHNGPIYALTTVLSLNYDGRSRLMLATTPTSTSTHLIPVEYLVSTAGTITNEDRNYLFWEGIVCDRDTGAHFLGPPLSTLVIE